MNIHLITEVDEESPNPKFENISSLFPIPSTKFRWNNFK